jgi:hypothetical protein
VIIGSGGKRQCAQNRVRLTNWASLVLHILYLVTGGKMNKDALHIFRVIVPGTILLLIFYFITNHIQAFSQIEILPEKVIYYVIVFVGGALYSIIPLRNFFMGLSLDKIDNNIKNKILDNLTYDPRIQKARNDISSGREIMNIFYNIIDNDASLIERTKEVYLNGLILSSIIDFVILAFFSDFILMIYLFISRNYPLLLQFFILLFLALIMWFVFRPLGVKKHIRLSNDQLAYIFQYYGQDLHSRIQKLL